MDKEIELKTISQSNEENKIFQEKAEDNLKNINESSTLIEMPQTMITEVWTGNTCGFLYYDGYPLITIGPDCIIYQNIGPFFIVLNIVVLIIVTPCIFFLMAKVSKVCTIIGIILLSLQMISYFLVFAINPGIPKPEHINPNTLKKFESNSKVYCKICHVIKRNWNEVYHCKDCNVCVEGYDHHCPWTGKCIGRRNLMFFYGFIIFTLIVFSYVMIGGALCAYFIINLLDPI